MEREEEKAEIQKQDWRVTKAIHVLERRVDHLRKRIPERTANGEPASFDASELAAMQWAVRVLHSLAIKGRLNLAAVPDIYQIEIDARLAAGKIPICVFSACKQTEPHSRVFDDY